MTREFNKQRRYDTRPSYRDTSSNFHDEERLPGEERTSRPRLNREIVDRAWENGAAHRHPDYHPRHNGQGPRNAWQKNQHGAPSSSNGSAGNRSYGHRQDNYQQHQQGNYQQNRQDNYQRPGRPPFNNERGAHWQQNDRPRYGGDERRSQTNWQGNNHQGRYNNDQQGQGRFRSYSQNAERGTENRTYGYNRGHNDGQRYTGNSGNGYNGRQGNTQGNNNYRGRNNDTYGGNDRGNYRQNGYQPRPSGQYGAGRPNQWGNEQSGTRPPYQERYEGDYERFRYEDKNQGQYQQKPQGGGKPAWGGKREEQAPERHVTRLPDGRVLKGPRPVQRKNAQFWTEVAEDTASVMGHVHTTEVPQEEANLTQVELSQPQAPKGGQLANAATPMIAKKPGKRIASAERRKKAAGARTYPPGPRPSQRGFKWPAS